MTPGRRQFLSRRICPRPPFGLPTDFEGSLLPQSLWILSRAKPPTARFSFPPGRGSAHCLHLMTIQFHEGVLAQGSENCREIPMEEISQFAGADVSGAHQYQFPRTAMQDVRVVEVGILGNEHPPIPYRDVTQLSIRRPITIRQVQGVNGVVSRLLQELAEAGRQRASTRNLTQAPSAGS